MGKIIFSTLTPAEFTAQIEKSVERAVKIAIEKKIKSLEFKPKDRNESK